MVTFILATLKRNWEKDSANTGTISKTADNNQPAAHIHKHQHEFDKDTEALILKGNLHQKHERELWEDKFICLLGTKAPAGLNTEFKHYGGTISSVFSEQFCFRRLDEISVFCGVPPPLTFLLKTLHCSYVNCNGFHKHERLFMIVVQQVPKRRNISLSLSKYVPQLSTPWWYLSTTINSREI